jgi:hypothetical protein
MALGEKIGAKRTIVDDVLFDSLMEAQAYRILRQNDLMDRAQEGINVHVRFHLGGKSIYVDFLLKGGTCVDIHHFQSGESMIEYWRLRKDFVPFPYFVFPSIEEMRLEVLVE